MTNAIAESDELINLSQTEGVSDLPQLHVFEKNVFVVWRDNSTGNDDIFFTKSSNEGISFGDHLNLSNNVGDSAFPRMAVADKNIYTVWYDYSPGQSDIFFAKSNDGGNSFETINLSDNGGVSYNPWVAANENNVFIVWNDETPHLKILNITKPKSIDVALGSLDILLATSRDGGSTFELSNLSDSRNDSWNPRITLNENNVYVVWNEKINSQDHILFTLSTDGGISFGKPIALSKTAGSSKDAAIRVVGNNVYVIWQKSGLGSVDIFFTKSDNNGISFSEPIKISNDKASELTRDTQMIVSENNVFIVWFDTSGDNGLFFTKSDDYGSTFSIPINLSGKVPNIQMAQIVGLGEDLYVIWQDDRLGNSEIFLRMSDDYGQSFGSILNLSNDPYESKLSILGPQIAATDQNIYTVFEKINEKGSDLFLQKTHAVQQKKDILVLQTINHQVNVELEIDKDFLEPETPLSVNLKFLEPATGTLLENVAYSFIVQDVSGNVILDLQNQLAENGHSTQIISFPETGPFTIIVDVQSVGDSLPYEDVHLGEASAVITVVSEFPVGIVMVMMSALIFAIIISKYNHNLQSLKQNLI